MHGDDKSFCSRNPSTVGEHAVKAHQLGQLIDCILNQTVNSGNRFKTLLILNVIAHFTKNNEPNFGLHNSFQPTL